MAHVVLDIGRSLRESGFMFWETLWALVFGFTLSGAVQAFVSKDQMRARLGDHRARSVARATGYGMVSSSCSYAASAMSKSLVSRGADFTSAMIFMIASTNLVVELGLVMLVLLGWQFAVAEFVGGPVMIILLALLGAIVFSTPLVTRVRTRLSEATSPLDEEMAPPDHSMRHLDGWSDASAYALADATMLRRELVVGYVVAGFLAVLVPASWWGDAFVHGHGNWTSLENAFVGPLIAVVSWVCSVGNVPLAAALWHGGISFGGVVAFIFGDLIAMPLIIIYRKFYGGALTVRLVTLLYGVMVVAGLITEILFRWLGLVPTSRTVHITADHLTWNYTTFLNLVSFVVAGVVWVLARRRRLHGTMTGYALDPVCKMQVRIFDAPARATIDEHTYFFCSDRCRDRFVQGHEAEAGVGVDIASPGATAITLRRRADVFAAEKVEFIDPICGMTVTPETAADRRISDGRVVYFCATTCANEFDRRHFSG